MLLNLLKKKRKRGIVLPSKSIGVLGSTGPVGIAFDIITSEEPDYSATPTQNVIEDGSSVSDHYQINPTKLTVHFVVSNYPIGLYSSVMSLKNVAGDAFGTTRDRTETEKATNAKTAHDAILEVRKLGLPFDFVSGFSVYPNMMITNYSPIRSSDTGDALEGTISMQEVRIVKSETVAVPKTMSTVKSVRSKQDNGKQAPLPPKESARRGASLYLQSLRGLGLVDY